MNTFKALIRVFEIFTYSFIAWLTISYISNVSVVQDVINNWVKLYNSINPVSIYLIYFLAGYLTKSILINAGDVNYQHSIYNEERYKYKSDYELHGIGKFDLILKTRQLIANPPLRLAMIFFFLLIYATNIVELKSYITLELAAYLIGFKTPQLIISVMRSIGTISYTIESKSKNKSWHQDEKPITDLSQDTLNRGPLVKKLTNIIKCDQENDTRGIAIIGPYGIGKSSIINMTMTELHLDKYNFLECKINSWGSYSSEEQIQRYLIEKMVNSLSSVTSTTKLSGLPSRYIHTLKGAQSLWLDILPLFDNHSSPTSQLAEIDDLLSKLDLKLVIIIEDLDRNKDAEDMLNSIAPLIDGLNYHHSFRFIISIGEKLNKPEIINRICRYNEYIVFDKSGVYERIKMAISKLLKIHNLEYQGNIEDFFHSGKNKTRDSIVKDELFSYISTPRELKHIIRAVDLHWSNHLYGYCDILDLLAVTILKTYEPILITALTNANPYGISFKQLEKNNENLSTALTNRNASELIIGYFFETDSGTSKPVQRLQSCRHDFRKYFNLIVEVRDVEEQERINEQLYFSNLKKLNKLCMEVTMYDEIYDTTLTCIEYRGYEQFIFDYSSLYFKSSIIPCLCIIIAVQQENKIIARINTDNVINKFRKLDIKNDKLIKNITHEITTNYLNINFDALRNFYSEINKYIPRKLVSKPNVKLVMNKFEEIVLNQHDKNYLIRPIYTAIELIGYIIRQNKNHSKYKIFLTLINRGNSEVLFAVQRFIKNYKIINSYDLENSFMTELKTAYSEYSNNQTKVDNYNNKRI